MALALESRPLVVSVAASAGIIVVALSIGYYLNLLIAIVWGFHVVSDEYDDLVNRRTPADKLPDSSIGAVSESSSLLGSYRVEPGGKLNAQTPLRSPLPTIMFRQSHLGGTKQTDEDLLETFEKLLSVGIIITLHTSKGPRSVRLFCIGDELKWESVVSAPNAKRYRMKLVDVVSVYKGKYSNGLKGDTEVPDQNCLSLVTERTSLDLEAANGLERDCLYRSIILRLREVKTQGLDR